MAEQVAFTAADGTAVTEKMLDEMFEDAERGELPGEPGPIHVGRPLSIQSDGPAAARSYRLGAEREAKLDRLAKERGLKDRSAVLRQLVDAA
jgi:hypothetical protein